MQFLILAFTLFLGVGAQALDVEKGMMALSCKHSINVDLEKDYYTVTAYSYKNGKGLLVVTNKDQVILTAPVRTGGNDAEFALAVGADVVFVVDSADKGYLEFKSKKKPTIYFDRNECSATPSGWPYPGSYRG